MGYISTTIYWLVAEVLPLTPQADIHYQEFVCSSQYSCGLFKWAGLYRERICDQLHRR